MRRRLTPRWPDDGGKARVLVEYGDGAVLGIAEQLLRNHGYDVATCGGPESLPRGRRRLAAVRDALGDPGPAGINGSREMN